MVSLVKYYNKQLEVSPFERFQLGDAGLSNSYALLLGTISLPIGVIRFIQVPIQK